MTSATAAVKVLKVLQDRNQGQCTSALCIIRDLETLETKKFESSKQKHSGIPSGMTPEKRHYSKCLLISQSDGEILSDFKSRWQAAVVLSVTR